MAEAHQPSFAALDPLDEGRNVGDRANLVEHPEHRLVRAAVQRAVQRRRRARHRGVGVGVRAADHAHRRGAAVLLVIRVQDEEHLERPLQRRADLVFELGHLEQHVQEVAGEAQVVVGVDVGAADAVAVCVRRDGGHLRDQAVDLLLAGFLVEDALRVRVEGREGADGAQEHAHRVRVVLESLHQLLDVLVQHRVERDLARPLIELRRGRQLAEHDEIRCLEIGRPLRELLDRVAAVHQDAAIAVDVGDRAAAEGRVHEGRVECRQPVIVLACLDLPQIGRADRAVIDGNLVLLPGAIVRDGERVGHIRSQESAVRDQRGARSLLVRLRSGRHRFCGHAVCPFRPSRQVLVAAALAAERTPAWIHGVRPAHDADRALAHRRIVSVVVRARCRARTRGGAGRPGPRP